MTHFRAELSEDGNHLQDRPKTQPEISKFCRESLIRATLQVVAEKGMQSGTITGMCSAAGVLHGHANHDFESKNQHLKCAFRALFVGLDAVSSEAAAAEAKPTRKLLAVSYATFSNSFFNRQQERRTLHSGAPR